MSKIKLSIVTTIEFDISDKGIKEFEDTLLAERVEAAKNPDLFDVKRLEEAFAIYDREGLIPTFLHISAKTFEEEYTEVAQERIGDQPEFDELGVSNAKYNVTVAAEVLP